MLGGIIYFPPQRLQSKEQVCGLSRELQLNSRSHTDIPLFICIDQEGQGRPHRLGRYYAHSRQYGARRGTQRRRCV